jgi:hypothetical protein
MLLAMLVLVAVVAVAQARSNITIAASKAPALVKREPQPGDDRGGHGRA